METATEIDTTVVTELISDLQDKLTLFTTDANTYDVTESAKSVHNSSSNLATNHDQVKAQSGVFLTFIILDIFMTAQELLLSIVAAYKIPRWRTNYRNQMLMQMSVARFIKRIIFFIQFMHEKSSVEISSIILSFTVYIDFVIIVLVCFFIKHMYDSLITVIVNVNKKTLYRVLCWSWLTPIPVSVVWTAITSVRVLEEWMSYFLICLLFRWPLMILGTSFYLTVLYKVLTDKIRKFARSLTIVTFLLCLDVNFYLFSKDVIKLWCFESFTTVIISYVLGFILNYLILCLYMILIILNFKLQSKSSNSLPNYSTATVTKDQINTNEVNFMST